MLIMCFLDFVVFALARSARFCFLCCAMCLRSSALLGVCWPRALAGGGSVLGSVGWVLLLPYGRVVPLVPHCVDVGRGGGSAARVGAAGAV